MSRTNQSRSFANKVMMMTMTLYAMFFFDSRCTLTQAFAAVAYNN